MKLKKKKNGGRRSNEQFKYLQDQTTYLHINRLYVILIQREWKWESNKLLMWFRVRASLNRIKSLRQRAASSRLPYMLHLPTACKRCGRWGRALGAEEPWPIALCSLWAACMGLTYNVIHLNSSLSLSKDDQKSPNLSQVLFFKKKAAKRAWKASKSSYKVVGHSA